MYASMTLALMLACLPRALIIRQTSWHPTADTDTTHWHIITSDFRPKFFVPEVKDFSISSVTERQLPQFKNNTRWYPWCNFFGLIMHETNQTEYFIKTWHQLFGHAVDALCCHGYGTPKTFFNYCFFAAHSSGHQSICRQCDGGMENVFKISFVTIEEDSLGSSWIIGIFDGL